MFRKAHVQASGSSSVVHDQLIGRHHQAFKKVESMQGMQILQNSCEIIFYNREVYEPIIVLQHKIKNGDNQRIGRSIDRESVRLSFDGEKVIDQERETL